MCMRQTWKGKMILDSIQETNPKVTLQILSDTE